MVRARPRLIRKPAASRSTRATCLWRHSGTSLQGDSLSILYVCMYVHTRCSRGSRANGDDRFNNDASCIRCGPCIQAWAVCRVKPCVIGSLPAWGVQATAGLAVRRSDALYEHVPRTRTVLTHDKGETFWAAYP